MVIARSESDQFLYIRSEVSFVSVTRPTHLTIFCTKTKPSVYVLEEIFWRRRIQDNTRRDLVGRSHTNLKVWAHNELPLPLSGWCHLQPGCGLIFSQGGVTAWSQQKHVVGRTTTVSPKPVFSKLMRQRCRSWPASYRWLMLCCERSYNRPVGTVPFF